MRRLLEVATAVAWGAVTHALFAVAVLAMWVGLHDGLQGGAGGLDGWAAAAANAALALQFPLLHSWLLSARGRALLARLAPLGLGRPLATTTFSGVAALQALATFALWSPSGVVLARAEGAAAWAWEAAYAASWVFLLAALRDAGPALQTGFVGSSSVLRGRAPGFRPFPTHGTFARCRQPVYLGFALTLWTGPVHTLDGLALASVWSAYCALGPLHKERRYLAWYGERYAAYQARVRYFFPRFRR